MALHLLDILIETVSIDTLRNRIVKIPPLSKTESQLDTHPDKIRARKGYYHDEQGDIYQLEVVKKVESQQYKSSKTTNRKEVTGNPEFIVLSQKLMFGNDCKRMENGSIKGFQSLGATGGMKVVMEYIHLKYGNINVYTPSLGWNVHQKIISTNALNVKQYIYPFASSKKEMFIDNEGKVIKFKKGDVILLHGCGHNPTGIDPTMDEWKQIIEIVKEHQLMVFFDYAYQGFVSGNIEKDSMAIKLFEEADVSYIFAVQSYSKNMGLYTKRIGCATIVCPSAEEAKAAINVICDKILNSLYDDGYPPNEEGADIVCKILADEENYAEWMDEVHKMYERIQKMRKLLYDKLRVSCSDIDWDFIMEQVGMFAYKPGLFDKDQIAKLKNEFSIYITDDGRIAMGCITNMKQMDYLVNAFKAILVNCNAN